jgi:hypothetical protein
VGPAEAEESARVIREISEEARRLLDEQRRSLRRADFSGLLAAAHGFHRLAERLSALGPATVAAETAADLDGLREAIARQGRLFDQAIAATASPSRGYARKQEPPTGPSILVDGYA